MNGEGTVSKRGDGRWCAKYKDAGAKGYRDWQEY
jgi:hypothetical protein